MSTPKAKNPTFQSPPLAQKHDVLPTLFGDGYGIYEVRKGSFVVSFVVNCAVLSLLVWIGSWTASHAPAIKQDLGMSVEISPYVLPPSKKAAGGGGGGGSHDIKPASKGALPKLAKSQMAPPTVLPMEQPKLPVAPTVVVPSEIKLPQLGQMGDPMAKVMSPLSNGTGVGGGIGSGHGGGVGSAPAPELVPAAAAASEAESIAWVAASAPPNLSSVPILSSAKKRARTSSKATCSSASSLAWTAKPTTSPCCDHSAWGWTKRPSRQSGSGASSRVLRMASLFGRSQCRSELPPLLTHASVY